MVTGRKSPRPILFGLRLDADPASYEILFLADIDSDHRIALVPFSEDPLTAADPLRLAFAEFSRLDPREAERYRRSAELIERK